MTGREQSGTLARMTPSTLVLAMLHDMDTGDFDAFRARFAPDAEWANPMVAASGPDEIAAGIGVYRAAFPDFRHDVSLVLAEGTSVAIEGAWLGTHTGPLVTPDGELPATGRAVRSPFAAIVRTRGEHVASVRVYMDPLAFMGQLDGSEDAVEPAREDGGRKRAPA